MIIFVILFIAIIVSLKFLFNEPKSEYQKWLEKKLEEDPDYVNWLKDANNGRDYKKGLRILKKIKRERKGGFMLSKQDKIDRRIKKALKTRIDNLAKEAKRTYLNFDWMFDHYCLQEMPIEKIAKLCKVEFDVIYFGLEKLGIPKISNIGSEKWHKWIEKFKNKTLKNKGLEKLYTKTMKNVSSSNMEIKI